MKNPSIPGLDLPVRTIYCIGKNYAKHAKEMGGEVPKTPIVFMKPLGAICYNESVITLPTQSNDVHHEAEIVVAIGKEGKNISRENALAHIAGYGAGIDFTARDIQSISKKRGTPWAIPKGFDGFAPISDFLPADEVENPENLDIKLYQDGVIKQQGHSSEMIFSIPQLITFLSQIFTLYPGDLIFTGTPEGVGPVESGNKLEVLLNNGITTLTVHIQ